MVLVRVRRGPFELLNMETEENPRIPGWPLVPDLAEVGDRFDWEGHEYSVQRMNNGLLGTIREAVVQEQVAVPMPNGELVQARRDFNERIPAFVEEGVDPFQRKQKSSPALRGESLFKLILSGIKEVFDVDAVIAGGAVRDLAVNAEKHSDDVDVFLPMRWEDFNEHQDQLGWEVRANKVHNAYSKNKKLKTSNRAHAQVQGMLVDLVFMDKPLDQEGVSKFPVNAQKCVWTLEGGLRISPEAEADLTGRQFTISDKITDKEAIKRIKEKVNKWLKREAYRGWKVIEPEIKEWWEKKKDDEEKAAKLEEHYKYYWKVLANGTA